MLINPIDGTGIPFRWEKVTLADADLPNGPCQALLVLTNAANVAVMMDDADSSTLTFTGCPSGLLIPGQFKQVLETGTTVGAAVYAAYSIETGV